jgi:hypothetical protein
VQMRVASVAGLEESVVSVAFYTGKPEFIYSKPTLAPGKGVQVQAFRDQKDTLKIGFTKQVVGSGGALRWSGKGVSSSAR